MIGKLKHQRDYEEIVLFWKGDYNDYLQGCDNWGNLIDSDDKDASAGSSGNTGSARGPSESSNVASSPENRSEAVDAVVQGTSKTSSPRPKQRSSAFQSN